MQAGLSFFEIRKYIFSCLNICEIVNIANNANKYIITALFWKLKHKAIYLYLRNECG